MTHDDQSGLDWRGAIPVSRRFDDPYFSLAGGLVMLMGLFILGLQAGTARISEILTDPPSGTATRLALRSGAPASTARRALASWRTSTLSGSTDHPSSAMSARAGPSSGASAGSCAVASCAAPRTPMISPSTT